MKNTTKYKLLYLFLFIEMGLFATYFPTYLSSLNFSKLEISRLLMIQVIAAIFIQPFLKYISNKYNCYNKVIKLSIIFSIVSLILYQYSQTIIIVVLITALYQIAFTNIIPGMDSNSINHTKKANTLFGSIRLFGSLGYIIGSFIGGYIYEWFTFSGNSFLSVGCLIVVIFLFSSINPIQEHHESASKGHMLFKNKPFIIFTIVYALLWSANQITDQYMIFLLKNFDKTQITLGYLLSIGVIIEMIVMALLTRFHFKKELPLIIIGAIFMLLRTASYAFINSYYIIVIATIVFKGFSIAFIISYALSYVSKLVPKEQFSNAVVLNVMIGSIIQLIALNTVSYTYEKWSVNEIYIILSIHSIVAIILLFFIQKIMCSNKKMVSN